jgi:hypothetical protein
MTTIAAPGGTGNKKTTGSIVSTKITNPNAGAPPGARAPTQSNAATPAQVKAVSTNPNAGAPPGARAPTQTNTIGGSAATPVQAVTPGAPVVPTTPTVPAPVTPVTPAPVPTTPTVSKTATKPVKTTSTPASGNITGTGSGSGAGYGGGGGLSAPEQSAGGVGPDSGAASGTQSQPLDGSGISGPIRVFLLHDDGTVEYANAQPIDGAWHLPAGSVPTPVTG